MRMDLNCKTCDYGLKSTSFHKKSGFQFFNSINPVWGLFWTKSCLLGKIWQWNHAKFFCSGVILAQNSESLLGYILKISGHACVHIVNYSSPLLTPVLARYDELSDLGRALHTFLIGLGSWWSAPIFPFSLSSVTQHN